MPDCKWMQDEICVNADCPMCCDFCPVVDVPGVCRFEEREITMDKIKNYLPDAEILAQLAEEAAELSQAALKLRRVIDGTNPTPKTREDAFGSLIEEYSDVVSCCRELNILPAEIIIAGKKERWINRLKEKNNEQS